MSAAERAKAAIVAAKAGAPKQTLESLIQAVIELDCSNPLFAAGYCEGGSIWEGVSADTAALCRAAASACVEAWQESRPRAEVREELLTVLRETSINQDLGFSIDEPGDVESLGCAVSDYAFRGSNKALRPACSRAAIALLHWRERMVDGE